jgi:hypothetical protein
MEEKEEEEDPSELLSSLMNFRSRFFLLWKISMVLVRIISGISVVMRRGD